LMAKWARPGREHPGLVQESSARSKEQHLPDVPQILSSASVWSLISGEGIGHEEAIQKEQLVGFLKEADRGIPVKDLAPNCEFSDASCYLWRKFGGMDVADAKRLKSREVENARLKRLLAESVLENMVTCEALRNRL